MPVLCEASCVHSNSASLARGFVGISDAEIAQIHAKSTFSCDQKLCYGPRKKCTDETKLTTPLQYVSRKTTRPLEPGRRKTRTEDMNSRLNRVCLRFFTSNFL